MFEESENEVERFQDSGEKDELHAGRKQDTRQRSRGTSPPPRLTRALLRVRDTSLSYHTNSECTYLDSPVSEISEFVFSGFRRTMLRNLNSQVIVAGSKDRYSVSHYLAFNKRGNIQYEGSITSVNPMLISQAARIVDTTR